MDILNRVKNIILSPKTEWDAVAVEPADVQSLYKDYILILAAIPPLATFLGAWIFGYSMGPMGTIRIGFFSGLIAAIIQYVLSLVSVFISGMVISYLAPRFGGEKSDIQGLKVAAYSYAPMYVAGIFALIPGLRALSILGLYSLYVLYVGLPKLMRSSEEKSLVYVIAIVVVTIVLTLLIGILTMAISPVGHMGGMF